MDELIARAGRLAASGGRHILGITGPPGVGKSTLAEAVTSALGQARAALVGMDGFHRSQSVLERLGRRDRMGAIDTFDDAGYAELIVCLAAAKPCDEPIVAPAFDRDIEEPTAAGVVVPSDVPLVVTEGNYLLARSGEWPRARQHMTEVWFVTLPEPTRQERLIARHIRHGKTPGAARDWALGPDQVNAHLIETTRGDADIVVDLDG